MVSPYEIRCAFGIVGNVTSFLLLLSPAKMTWRIWKNKSVEEFEYHTVVAGIMNCIVWVFYSMPFVHPHSILVTTINSIGLVMYIGFNLVYLTYCDNKKRKSMALYYLGEMVILAAIICATLFELHTHQQRSFFVGIFCDTFSILFYASPLTAMFKVYETKSVEFMPLPISLAVFAKGVIWSVYALIYKFDLYILMCNGFGVILGVLQLIVYAIYYSSTPKKEKEVSKPSQVQISTTPYTGVSQFKDHIAHWQLDFWIIQVQLHNY